jgi:hypothetical protein
MSQADKPDGGIDFANLVTSDGGSMPIDPLFRKGFY